MKKLFLLFVLTLFCVYLPVSFADYDDGYITEGEYEFGVDWNSYDPPLIVEGGGRTGLK